MTHLYVIVVLVALNLAGAGDGPWVRGLLAGALPAPLRLVGAIAPYIVLGLGAWAVVRVCARRLDRTGAVSAVRLAHRALLASRVLALGWHLASIPVLGVLGLVREATGDQILVDELLAASPALLFLLWTVRLAYPIERRVRAALLIGNLDAGGPVYPFPGPVGYTVGQARNSIAIIFVPLVLLLAWAEGLDRLLGSTRVLDGLGLGADGALLAESGIQIAGAVAVFAAVPVLMVRVWDTVPIPPGVLRSELEGLARAHRVRVSRFLIWRTRGAMLNGAVIGITPLARFVVLTDALLDALSEPQVEAVAAHEIAHVKKRHMLWLAVAILGSALLSGEALGLAAERLGAGALVATVIGAVASLASVVLVLGHVSRRFEWQADAFAARHLSGAGQGSPVVTHEAAEAMSGALARVARLNGVSESRFTWRHGSIATRRRRLEALVGLPVDDLPIDRGVRTLRWLSALGFLAGVALTIAGGLGLWPYAPL
jgi:Zn-dependent protease with chaperone function